jgi:L-asparagine transporter-like permease
MSASVETGPPTADGIADLVAQEKNFRRTLGFWSLTATSFGGIIGSGWLFSALYGAQIAGPASLVSWVIAGGAVALVSLVLIELGASRPEAGGSVRWPLYANGRIVGTTFGWTVILGLISDTEVLAVTQYLSHYWPWLYSGQSLSIAGIGIAALLEAVIVVVNWFGIRLVAQINLVITWLKFLVPAITIIALFASGFHGGNISAGGGFAPYGWGAVLSAISTGGLIYAVNGFQPPVDLSGEARNPRRDLPRAILTAIGLSVVVYLLLELAFLGAVPHSLLAAHGWKGIDFTSPFGQLAVLLNLGWLASLLYVDAVLSPSGSELIGTTEGARQTYALAKNRTLPKYFLSVPDKHARRSPAGPGPELHSRPARADSAAQLDQPGVGHRRRVRVHLRGLRDRGRHVPLGRADPAVGLDSRYQVDRPGQFRHLDPDRLLVDLDRPEGGVPSHAGRRRDLLLHPGQGPPAGRRHQVRCLAGGLHPVPRAAVGHRQLRRRRLDSAALGLDHRGGGSGRHLPVGRQDRRCPHRAGRRGRGRGLRRRLRPALGCGHGRFVTPRVPGPTRTR